MGCAATLPHNHAIGGLSMLKVLEIHRYYVLKMSVNGASTIFGRTSWKILGLCGEIKLESVYRLPF
jgi:hypothetical protein